MMTSIARVGVTAAAVLGGVFLLTPRAGRIGEHAVTLPAPMFDSAASSNRNDEAIVFAGGCFWGVQAVFEHVRGVKSAVSGYAGGTMVSPSYEDVSSGTTGHAESVRVVFDPSQVSLGKLLQVFFSVAHDPTQKNR